MVEGIAVAQKGVRLSATCSDSSAWREKTLYAQTL